MLSSELLYSFWYNVEFHFQINSYMELNDISCVPEIYWSITQIINDTFFPITYFAQPETSVLRLEPFLLEPGDFVVTLEVTFPTTGPNVWIMDHLVLKVLLPELVTHISGGDFVDVPHGGVVMIDATLSADPADNLTALENTTLTSTWSFSHYLVLPPPNFYKWLSDVAKAPPILPLGGTTYEVLQGTDYLLEVDTTYFGANTLAVIMFTLTRGSRSSIYIQAIRFVPNAVPLRIE